MKSRVFLDTTTFIYAFEFPESNSAKIIGLLNQGVIEAITSEQVIKEITRYFEKFHNIKLARKFRRYIFDNCTVIFRQKVLKEIKELRGQIKDKDLEQLAVVKKFGIKYLIAYDRDFDKFPEYVTPKQFLDIYENNTAESDF